jgi:site-specific DNA-cytosine methylase
MHWAERRRFSLPEFKRFGSFPDKFAFAGAFEEGIRQIGNSDPPLFMMAIALHIHRRYRIMRSLRCQGRSSEDEVRI